MSAEHPALLPRPCEGRARLGIGFGFPDPAGHAILGKNLCTERLGCQSRPAAERILAWTQVAGIKTGS